MPRGLINMKKKYIQLPKSYLSFSQITLWQSNPERYKKLYFEGDQSYNFTNDGMRFGSKVADALEHKTQTGELLTDIAIELMPQYDVRDEEIVADLKTEDGWIKVLGRPDSLDSETKDFVEFKTGKVKWTQTKAEKHLQLRFYAMLIYLEYGVVPGNVALIWMETHKNTDGETEPTGRIEKFPVKIELKDILETMAITSKVAKEIEAAWVIYERPADPKF